MVPIQHEAAKRTTMNTNSQRFHDLFTATRANLTRIVGRHFDYCSTSFYRFVGQHFKEHSPGRIRYAFGEVMIFDHVANLQIFNVDSAIVLNVVVRRLMQKVFSLIGDFIVTTRNQCFRLYSSLRATLLSGKATLSTLSDGTVYKPLNIFRQLQSKLAGEQRKLSRKVKRSKNWYKQKQKITLLHIKIADAAMITCIKLPMKSAKTTLLSF